MTVPFFVQARGRKTGLPLLVLALLLLPACRRSGPATPVAPATLAAIAAEQNSVLRLHLLANWVANQDEKALAQALSTATPALKPELAWLVGARLAQLYPKDDDEARARRLNEFWSEAETAGAPATMTQSRKTVQDILLELARTDPGEALARAAKARLHPNDADKLRADILIKAAETDPLLALSLLKDRRDVDHASVGREIVEAWGKRDAAAAMKWLATQPHTYATNELGAAILSGWSMTDLSAAMEAAASMTLNKSSETTVRSIAARWLKEDPAQAAEWLAKQPRLDPLLVKAAIDALADSRPELAAHIFTTQVPPSRQLFEGDRLIYTWAAKDPEACLAWLQTRPANAFYARELNTVASRLAEKNPAAAMALLNGLPADIDRGPVVRAIASGLADHQAALDWLVTLPESKIVTQSIQQVIDQMSGGNPDALLALASHFPSGPRQSAVYASVAAAKFDQNPETAITWLKTVNDREHMQAIVAEVGYRWAETDPRGAAEFVRQLPAGEAYERMVASVAEKFSVKDPSAAVAWALSLADTQAGRNAVGRTFAELARNQPETVAARIAALPAGEFRDYAVSYSVSRLAETKPAAGVELVTQVASPKQQAMIASQLTDAWSRNDLAGSLAWASALPAGELRDGAVSGLARTGAEADPGKMLVLAGTMGKDSRKYEMIQNVLTVWYVQNPTAALAALSGLNLPAEKRDAINRQLVGK